MVNHVVSAETTFATTDNNCTVFVKLELVNVSHIASIVTASRQAPIPSRDNKTPTLIQVHVGQALESLLHKPALKWAPTKRG